MGGDEIFDEDETGDEGLGNDERGTDDGRDGKDMQVGLEAGASSRKLFSSLRVVASDSGYRVAVSTVPSAMSVSAKALSAV